MSLVVPIFFLLKTDGSEKDNICITRMQRRLLRQDIKTEKLNGQYSNTRELYHIDDDKESRNWISSQE